MGAALDTGPCEWPDGGVGFGRGHGEAGGHLMAGWFWRKKKKGKKKKDDVGVRRAKLVTVETLNLDL